MKEFNLHFPVCCGVEMRAYGGYQMGGTKDWINWRCPSCHTDKVMYGHLGRIDEKDADGLYVISRRQTWVPLAKPVLTVLTAITSEGILCRGLAQDVSVFENVLVADDRALIDQIGRRYSDTYRVIFNLP